MLVGAIGLFVLSVWFAERVRSYTVYTLPEILERQYEKHDSAYRFDPDRRRVAGNHLSADHSRRQDTDGPLAGPGHAPDDHRRISLYHIPLLGGQYSILRTI
jgi:hypothetical protein